MLKPFTQADQNHTALGIAIDVDTPELTGEPIRAKLDFSYRPDADLNDATCPQFIDRTAIQRNTNKFSRRSGLAADGTRAFTCSDTAAGGGTCQSGIPYWQQIRESLCGR